MIIKIQKMRKFIPIILMLPGLLACNKTLPLQEAEILPDQGEETVYLTIGVKPDYETKSTASWSEEAVKTLTVFVFDEDGTLDVSGTSSTSSVTVKCKTGQKDVYAVVNKSITASIGSTSDLTSVTSTLADNTTESFVMYGKGSFTITANSDNMEIEVSRIAAKVTISSISNALKETAYKSKEFKISAIYLQNVAEGNYPLFADSYTPSLWGNQMKYVANTTYDKYLYDAPAATVASGSTYSTKHSFYCYPNPTETDTEGGTWSARFTRLVVAASIGGETYYYPITLGGGIGSNLHYTINNLKITRLGSTDPDETVKTVQATFKVNVNGWTEYAINDVEI